ncbi:transglycosylase SLT domain-containing protein [Photobacterium alginatilyticum]|uniref:transglycosylase SLT domain-containing protein n=1 Tax=Photobacterium alginatilyticum TaxID=1775171 RepID=UPI004067EE34
MAKFVTPIVLGMSLISSLAIAQDTVETDSFSARKASMLSSFSESKQASIDAFENSKAQYLAKFNEVKKELSEKWDTPQLTNKTTWVQYSQNNDIKRSVNFETGEITVEVVGNNLTEKEISAVVNNQLSELKTETTAQAYNRDPVLAGATPSRITANEKVLPDVNVNELTRTAKTSSFKQSNGLQLTKVSMSYPTDRIAKKAMTYMPTVLKNASKWEVDPDLILAIMHTESHFNPMAQSHIPAYGLMQVVPTSAGRDVTKRYLGKEKLLPPEVLFKPDFNIDIGTAYLNVLQAHYLRKVNDPTIRTYLAISAYNGGIGAVAKHFTGKGSLSRLADKVNTLQPDDVYQSLVNDFPYKETRNYLKKVHTKQTYYKNLLQASVI